MTPINERIRYPQVRVISDTGEQLGVMDTRDALQTARSRGYDLILVAPQAQPPVCRIMDYGKFKYEKSKRDKKAKNPATELKMVRLHPRTGVHDRDILVRHAERFLRQGHKVRAVCQFKGRENAYPQIGREQLDAIANALAEISIVEGPINKQGRDMTMMLAPKPGLKPLPKPEKNLSKKGQTTGESDEEDDDDEEEAELEAIQARLDAESGDDDDEDDSEEAQTALPGEADEDNS